MLLLSSCAGKQGQLRTHSHTIHAPDGTALDVHTLGKGQPLLLLTGYAMTTEMWDKMFVKDLATSRHIILLDNVGMGSSRAKPGTVVSIQRMANDAVTVLDALKINKCDILGWSMGGMIAQELALARPDKVRSLVLLSSASEVSFLTLGLKRVNSMDELSIRQAMFQPDWLHNHPDASGRVGVRPRSPDGAIIQGQLQAILGWNGTTNRLEGLYHPMLIMVGNDDWLCPPEASRAIHARLSIRPGNPSVFVEFGMGSHWMMHQFPATLSGMIDGYLSSLECEEQ
jgi:pimeloyl-ACP methyl ester carboxylesterase